MLTVNHLSGFGARASTTADGGIPGRVWEWDAGDAASYAGGQTVANLVASPADGSATAAYDLWVGASGSVEASDPAFSGVVDAKSAAEFFTFATDELRFQGPTTAFLESMHKAGAEWTIAIVFYPTSLSTGGTLFGTALASGAVASTGIELKDDSFQIRDGNAPPDFLYAYETQPTENAWNVMVLGVGEAVGLGRTVMNGAYHEFAAGYPSPSAGGADGVVRFGMEVSGGGVYLGRIARAAVWNRLLGSADMVAVCADWMTRYA